MASGRGIINTTLVVCTSAAGHYVAPMIIFKRKRMMAELAEGAPPGCSLQVSDTGYINSDLFVVWLPKFIEVVRPTPDQKLILVLDCHSTHSKKLEAINLARDNGVILLQLPEHTTHRLQPLDVAIFMQVYYKQAVKKWMEAYPGLAMTQYQVAKLLMPMEKSLDAYGKAATIRFAINEFSKCGIGPVNRNVSTDIDFAGKANIHIEEKEEEPSYDDIPLSRLASKADPKDLNNSKVVPKETPRETFREIYYLEELLQQILKKNLKEAAKRNLQSPFEYFF
ncbi:uncharacterized protein LOC115889576 [Sitophilus oryzae]|uniref:Uncharacterized protein LOC115889576 n=1 Tax=Sitophilus oryzae TaxID=7048 RepID=A0A6J2YNC3_SITOR|nr:uncharacterized protein LOC115889576 [Sitophilus oryzae]